VILSSILFPPIGDRNRTPESWPGVGKAMCAGQSGMAVTRGNGNVDKLLKEVESGVGGDDRNDLLV